MIAYGRPRLSRTIIAALVTIFVMGIASVAAESEGRPEQRAPAGQVCPRGSYVIGFDDEANILCSEACGNEVLDAGEACDDGNTISGDGCSSTCQSEAGAGVAMIAVETTPVDQEVLPSIEGPVIESVKPGRSLTAPAKSRSRSMGRASWRIQWLFSREPPIRQPSTARAPN